MFWGPIPEEKRSPSMDAGQVTLDSSMAMITQQLQTTTEMQLAMLKKNIESQQQMVKMLAAAKVGENIDVTA
jgi:hypothetical protein